MQYSERRKNLKWRIQNLYAAGATLRGESTNSIVAYLNEDGIRKDSPTIIIAPHFNSKKDEVKNTDSPDINFIYVPCRNSDLIKQIHLEEKDPWNIEVELRDRTFYHIYRNYHHLNEKVKSQLQKLGHPFSLDGF